MTFNGFDLTASGATGTYQWIKDGITIIGATSSTYKPTQNGNYKVKITDANGCTGESSVYVLTNVGIKELSKNDIVQVYPNPANDVIKITANGIKASRATISIYAVTGNLVFKQSVEIRNGILNSSCNLAELPKGNYEIRLQTDTGTRFIKPLVIQ
jgi:hypothetical protein